MLTDMNSSFDVIIAGGGLNGPTLGLALAGAGLNIAVIDSAPARARAKDNFDGRAYALALASVRLLKCIGLWDELAPTAQPIKRVIARQGRGPEISSPGLDFNGEEIEGGILGQILEDRFLYRALIKAMPRHLTYIPETQVIGQTPGIGGIDILLSDGQSLNAQLLVGADGRRSGVAERAGITRISWDYDQTALVTALTQQVSHESTAHQVFLPTGPLAVLPLLNNHSSIVWSMPRARAKAIETLSDKDFLVILSGHIRKITGEITLAGPRFSYPLNLTLAKEYVADRTALIGDAAHGVHPVAGQGLNLGLRDVAALAECIIDAVRIGEDIGSSTTLNRYQGWRRYDSTALALGMDGVTRLFSNDNPLLRAARGFGMGMINTVPAVRQHYMRQAAGLAINPMPRLLAGKPLI